MSVRSAAVRFFLYVGAWHWCERLGILEGVPFDKDFGRGVYNVEMVEKYESLYNVLVAW